MTEIEKVKEIIGSKSEELNHRYHVSKIGIFGSRIRGDSSETSDIDILVDFSEPIGLIDFIKLENYLSKLLKLSVDLVPEDGIKPALRSRILNEVVYI